MLKILVLNTGGTFNKIYDHISGELIVPKNNNFAINKMLNLLNNDFLNFEIEGLIYKDSLEMTQEDRVKIADFIKNKLQDFHKIIIVHGTDTMNLTAEYLYSQFNNSSCQIILIGAMKPISIDPIDGAINFGVAIGFLQTNHHNGVYIAMSGLVAEYNQINKNRAIGQFQILNQD